MHATGEWVLLAALLLLPGVAAGQSAVSPPRVSIGAGAGIAFPFHGDFDFTPWAWEADLRVLMSRHTLFEAAVGEWRCRVRSLPRPRHLRAGETRGPDDRSGRQ